MYYFERKPFTEWQIPGFDHEDNEWSNKLIIAFDTEYKPSVTKTINIGGNPTEVLQRRLKDILSLQLAFNYENNNPVQVFIHREEDDDPFDFNLIFKLVKRYLTKIGVNKYLKKYFKAKAFYFEFWGFWSGTDISTLKGYEEVLTENMNSKDAKDAKKNPSKLVSMNINTLFTSKPLKLSIKDKYRHNANLFPKQRLIIRDLIKLAPGKSNLAMLGEMIGLPKLDTEDLDRMDNKTEGYYKTHMDELWSNRQSDFIKYAMTDTVITAEYGQFIIGLQDQLMDQGFGKFKPGELKTSIGSIVSNIVGERNVLSADWIIDVVKQKLQEFNGSRTNVTSYLSFICNFKNKKDAKKQFDALFVNRKMTRLDAWLRDHLDFDVIRKGYKFPRIDSNNERHKHLVNDITTHKDAPLAKSFNEAVDAFAGGYNLVMEAGVIDNHHIKADVDSTAAYSVGGTLIPDQAPALGYMGQHYVNVGHEHFIDIVNFANTVNGPYTTGIGTFSIQYPDDCDDFVITPQRVDDGPRYFKHIENVKLCYTDAYTAWLCGAKVFTHDLRFDYQAKLNGQTLEGVSHEGIVQDEMRKHRSKYPDGDPMNVMYKNIGNQTFGSTGMGLREKVSRDFNNGLPFYIPFSRITNPYKVVQYTAITRLHIILLERAIRKVDSTAVFLNCVTDGLLVMTEHTLDYKAVNQAIDDQADPRYRDVIKYHFDGKYFKPKDTSTDTVANLRSRLTFSRDEKLHALVGIRAANNPPAKLFKDYLDQGEIMLAEKDNQITSLVTTRHESKFDHLQSSWDTEKDIYFGFDFSRVPTDYVVNDQFVYWHTRAYEDVDEFNNLHWFGVILIKYAPYYMKEYAPFFKKTIDEKLAGYWVAERSFGSFVEKRDENEPVHANEVYQNWLRYCLRNSLDLDASYQTIVDLFDENGWIYANARGDDIGLPQLSSFKKAKYRYANNLKSHGEELINYVLLHYVGLI